jgi:hypothetical protein
MYVPDSQPICRSGIDDLGIYIPTFNAQHRLIMSFDEVTSVHAKAGRAETPTDPALLDMNESVVVLRRQDQWPVPDIDHDGFSGDPEGVATWPGPGAVLQELKCRWWLDRGRLTLDQRPGFILRVNE